MNSKLNLEQLSHLNYLEELDDHGAEQVSGGSFTYRIGAEFGFIDDTSSRISISNIPNRLGTTVGVANANPSRTPSDLGHNFVIEYLRNGQELARETVTFGNAATIPITNEMTAIRILQDSDIDFGLICPPGTTPEPVTMAPYTSPVRCNAPPPRASDRRTKTDIKVVGFCKDLGIQLYSWKYCNDDPTRYVGVMAQDLLARTDLAHAVVIISEGEFAGYYAVNYQDLGLKMITEAEWQEQGMTAVASQPLVASV